MMYSEDVIRIESEFAVCRCCDGYTERVWAASERQYEIEGGLCDDCAAWTEYDVNIIATVSKTVRTPVRTVRKTVRTPQVRRTTVKKTVRTPEDDREEDRARTRVRTTVTKTVRGRQ